MVVVVVVVFFVVVVVFFMVVVVFWTVVVVLGVQYAVTVAGKVAMVHWGFVPVQAPPQLEKA